MHAPVNVAECNCRLFPLLPINDNAFDNKNINMHMFTCHCGRGAIVGPFHYTL